MDYQEIDFNTWIIIGVCVASIILLVALLKKDEMEHLERGAAAQSNAEVFEKLDKLDKRHNLNTTTEYPSTSVQGQSPFFSTPEKNYLWLFFGSSIAVGAAFYLFHGARQSSKRRIISISLYGAAALLCIEVFVTLVRFFTRS